MVLTLYKFQPIFAVKFPTKCTFRIFHTLEIDRISPFCNLFMERPSYFKNGHYWESGSGIQKVVTLDTQCF